MNNKKFGILLSVINVLSIITLEKSWKRGFKITFKKHRNHATASVPVVAVSCPAVGSDNSVLYIVA